MTPGQLREKAKRHFGDQWAKELAPIVGYSPRHGASAGNEAHRRIAREPAGIVDILVSGHASEHRLTELRDHAVTAVAVRPPEGFLANRSFCSVATQTPI